MTSFSEKTWREIGQRDGEKVIIPLGSVEQHGPHLPLDTDSLLVERIALKVGEKTGCLVIPTICFGVSEEHMDFRGTLTLSPDSFKAVVYDICKSLKRHGFREQHVVNYHGGNKKYLLELIPEIKEMGVNVSLHRVLGRLGKFDHAGEVETSLMLYLFPEKVRRDKIDRFQYKIPEGDKWRTRDYSKTGVIGEAVDASEEKGRQYFNKIVDELVEEIKDECI
jgi:creatinine amidohydrolase